MTTDTKAVTRYVPTSSHGGMVRIEGSGDGTYVSDSDHERVVGDLRAELAAKSEDARRWQYARRILPVLYIEDSHEKYVLWGRDDSEIENSAADRAIDAAMEKGNV